MKNELSHDAQVLNVVLVTGVSGAGKSTALRSLEDLGYEAVDNVPLGLMERLLFSGDGNDYIAIGVDIRTRGLDASAFLNQIQQLATRPQLDLRLLFVDCDDDTLVHRFEETRRLHPLATDRPVSDGIREERAQMTFLRDVANIVIDTTDMKPGDMKPMLEKHFEMTGQSKLNIFVVSFGFKHGLPRDADLVFDVRFLRNPHYKKTLRPLSGLDPEVASFIRDDSGLVEFLRNLKQMLSSLFPRYSAEGKSYLTIAVGCTGGQHRSVFIAEELMAWIAEQGESVYLRHRDLENMTK